jgi:hypothetical protein
MTHRTNIRSNTAAELRIRSNELADRVGALIADIAALGADMKAADSESVRRVSFGCLTSVEGMQDAVRCLRDMADDLERIEAASAPGVCSVPWGVCPEYGNTLASSGGKTWCRAMFCRRTWDHDRAGLPCAEPARWALRDQLGGVAVMCDGHARDAAASIDGAKVDPLGCADRKASA